MRHKGQMPENWLGSRSCSQDSVYSQRDRPSGKAQRSIFRAVDGDRYCYSGPRRCEGIGNSCLRWQLIVEAPIILCSWDNRDVRPTLDYRASTVISVSTTWSPTYSPSRETLKRSPLRAW